ncbi:DMT family transporter [Limosilactobacillus sp. STM2_1]|uniref:DMT family transporter n=1 Tax=Limosilactobacillus rudii TaxID=2759755 RepID=A0A7W3UME1_9LACO|nr:DMT family transporter [Limosilactobacillus rudii]MBB1078881.1 DMT family transporter [Limosilactobacillus rudii]MBB1098243.1 DMT family transporter [Limosilactobacillus rudii]MCD7135642.1 DMT family transporter [Limosilactobacillus rudii]
MSSKAVPKKQLWGIELNLVSLLLSSISPVLNKFSLVSLSPVVGGIFTSFFATIFVLTTIFIMHRRVSFTNLKNPWLWLLGGTNAIGIILQYVALSSLSPITVTLIARMYLVYVFFLSYVFLKEKITKWDYLAIILCIVGSFFISGSRLQFSDNVLGLICAFIYPLMYAANNIIAKYLVGEAEPSNVLFYNHLTSALLLLCYALITSTSFNNISGRAVAFNFGGAFFNGFMSLLLFYTSLKFITAGKANIVRALGPVVVIIYSSFFFPVQVTPSLITGAILVIMASTIVTFTKTNQG